MKQTEVKERRPDLLKQLLSVWERFVKTTHLFLSDHEIEKIKKQVLHALQDICRIG